ncbi:caspase domain-containing protein [Mycena pura]|uniref:Caspase domain-containing protein n=1 Tax=Mycena pura TaxID=153505 RepID=A0AAD6XXR8_9AGAR|nr:caspase domain-containing protein [Mycena pura]
MTALAADNLYFDSSSCASPSPSSSRPWRDSKRKALLIGINGLSSPNAGFRVLHGPHRDVAEMRRLLIETYDYREEDIQVLVDDGIPGHIQPERGNILLAIQNLVDDTRKGDKLFFLYCGHTIQVPTRSPTEEDALDECLVPLDGEEHIIKDNELRARLVDPLPAGASLVAVFDSCHSASLLDLEHLRCNRVFVPWLSKSKRKSDEMRNRMVRRLAIPILSPSSTRTSQAASARSSPIQLRLRRTCVDAAYSPTLSPRCRWYTGTSGSDTATLIDSAGTPCTTAGTACDSPEAAYCQGWCGRSKDDKLFSGTQAQNSPEREFADVISLAACKDSEVSWENAEGISMTWALIHVLTEDAHPTLRELVTKISHALHALARERHSRASAWMRYRKAHAMRSSGLGSFDTESFQHPQVASHKPLDMEMRWAL